MRGIKGDEGDKTKIRSINPSLGGNEEIATIPTHPHAFPIERTVAPRGFF